MTGLRSILWQYLAGEKRTRISLGEEETREEIEFRGSTLFFRLDPLLFNTTVA
jgi:hypothetical protein